MLISREHFAELYERIKASAEESNRRSCAEAAALALSGGGGLDEDEGGLSGGGGGGGAAASSGAAGGCFVLILAAMSADAVCAARMLTTLLGHDAITFRLVPVAGNMDVGRAVLTAREPSIVLLDCGATANLTRLRGVPDYACIYVIDSHLPGEEGAVARAPPRWCDATAPLSAGGRHARAALRNLPPRLHSRARGVARLTTARPPRPRPPPRAHAPTPDVLRPRAFSPRSAPLQRARAGAQALRAVVAAAARARARRGRQRRGRGAQGRQVR
jgi:hypothetical protein